MRVKPSFSAIRSEAGGVRVKICGVTTVADAALAVRAGADAIGLNFYERSPRVVSAARARRIVASLPPFVWAVGVFVNHSAQRINRLAREVGLHVVQLHGDEPESLLPRLQFPVFRALHVGVGRLAVSSFRGASALVLDAAQPGYGGGGRTFDWSRAKDLAARRAVLLAGGLTPDNVAAAIAAVRPLGVDVASGVESRPGTKDPRAVAAFVRAVRSAV
jgi:phosphoribosylanthranilate isomerase